MLHTTLIATRDVLSFCNGGMRIALCSSLKRVIHHTKRCSNDNSSAHERAHSRYCQRREYPLCYAPLRFILILTTIVPRKMKSRGDQMDKSLEKSVEINFKVQSSLTHLYHRGKKKAKLTLFFFELI